MKAPYILAIAGAAACLTLAAACTVHQTEAPGLTGPSDLALSLRMQAIPDTIGQDGGSQSSVKVFANGPDGKPINGLPFRVDMAVDTGTGLVTQDFGALSARSIVTLADGSASVVYTAPPAPPNSITGTCNGLPGQCVSIIATPTGNNFGTLQPQSVTIRLVPLGVILPPAGTPTAAFTMSPSPALMNVPVTFDASSSQIGTGATQITSYSWSFGDGSQGSGRTVTHTFTSLGTVNVSLTVVNDRGLSASTTVAVNVGSVSAPVATFVISPTTPQVGQTVVFNADQSTAAPGHTLTAFNWNFGDGGTASGFVVSHVFTTAGTFSVVLSVLDDTGQKSTTTQPVTASPTGGGAPAAAPTARFTFSPTAPATGQNVFFNASTSTPGAGHTIASYAWNFGDGSTGTGVTPTKAFASAGTFNVTLTVTDEAGQTGVTFLPITITGGGGAGTAPTSTFTFSPAAPGVGETVFFNASTSTPGAGHTITSYAWTFGDGSTGSGVTVTHAYSTAGSYAVQLRVTDEAGQATTSAATTINVGSPPSPTANFTFSPAQPGRNDLVVFDASSSTTSQGQTIKFVDWNFGDGTPVVRCPGPSTDCQVSNNRISSHTFGTAQTFVVNLVVTDTADRIGSRSVNVTVVLAEPTVRITSSPSAPNPGTIVSFNSNATTYFPGSGPLSFAWTFGDGGSCSTATFPVGCGTGSAANPTHAYAAVGSYSAALSVTDTKFRTGTAALTVTVVAVTPPLPPVAAFTPSVAVRSLAVSGLVNFDAASSTSPSGAAITNYRWNFGDGSAIVNTASDTISHTYTTTVGSPFTVTLIVTTGSNGLTGTTTGTVTVTP